MHASSPFQGRDTYSFNISGEHILKNVRFKNDDDIVNVRRYDLVIGGQRVDSLDDVFYSQLQIFYEMDGIPLYFFKHGTPGKHEYHDISIVISGVNVQDIILLVDKYKPNIDPPNYPGCHEYLTYHLQPSSMGSCGLDVFQFYGPVYFFMANKRIYDIVLHIKYRSHHNSGKLPDKKEYSFKLKQDKNGFINLTDNLKLEDFSTYCMSFGGREDKRISYKCLEEGDILIGTVYLNVARHMSGMIGMSL